MTAAVPALRKTWRRSAEHFAEQVKRFLRLTALAALPSLVSLLQGGQFDRRTLYAFIVPCVEVAYREMFPALGAAAAHTAPGVSIVPAQVGIPSDPVTVQQTIPSTSAAAVPDAAMADPTGTDPGLLDEPAV